MNGNLTRALEYQRLSREFAEKARQCFAAVPFDIPDPDEIKRTYWEAIEEAHKSGNSRQFNKLHTTIPNLLEIVHS